MKAVVEGLLFLSGEDGISLENICKIIEKDINETQTIINELCADYKKNDRGMQIEFLGNNYKLTTKPIHKEYYKKLVSEESNSQLTQSSLETLAIIAYNGPITRIEVDNIRGVNSSYVIRKLLIKGLIEDVGNSDAPGRPKLYNVTSRFLDYFGLGNINELPKIEENEAIDLESNLFESKYKENETE